MDDEAWRGATAMTGPETAAAIKAVQASVQKLDAWRQQNMAATRSKEAQDAAQAMYHAALIPCICRSLNLEFRALNSRIQELATDVGSRELEAVADDVAALADKEDLVGRLLLAVGFLQRHAARGPGRFGRLARRIKKQNERDDAERTLSEIADIGEQALRVVGAREHFPTPPGITEVETALHVATTPEALAHAKSHANTALEQVDRLLLREAHEKLGQLRSALSEAYGLPPPPELEF
jgi:hypothetical protein